MAEHAMMSHFLSMMHRSDRSDRVLRCSGWGRVLAVPARGGLRRGHERVVLVPVRHDLDGLVVLADLAQRRADS